ncbi:response regulator [Cobetia crustatorum]|uniref:response regulator n=1 Tax=Cobetia crustatorum TaxID=553385 RepID=UPI00046961B9|nr:response regulator transcription factor [Cobetia crustatorum]
MYRVLIADDHPLFRDAISRTLSAQTSPLAAQKEAVLACELLEAASLGEALAVIEANADTLDLVLLDLDLPDSHGLDGLTRLRAEADWLPVAILSAHEERATVLEALTLGAVGYLSKSTSAEALREALTRMLAGEIHVPASLMRTSMPRPPMRDDAADSASRSASPRPTSPPLIPAMSDTDFLVHWQALTGKQRGVLQRMVLGESNKMIAWQLGVAETTVKTHVSAILRKLGVSSRVQAILIASRALGSAPPSPSSSCKTPQPTPHE